MGGGACVCVEGGGSGGVGVGVAIASYKNAHRILLHEAVAIAVCPFVCCFCLFKVHALPSRRYRAPPPPLYLLSTLRKKQSERDA